MKIRELFFVKVAANNNLDQDTRGITLDCFIVMAKVCNIL